MALIVSATGSQRSRIDGERLVVADPSPSSTRAAPSRLPAACEPVAVGGLQTVACVQVVGKGLGPVLERVSRRVGRDEAAEIRFVDPVSGASIVLVERRRVVDAFVTEQRTEVVDLVARG